MLSELVDVPGAPLGRRVRRFAKCRKCGWWMKMPIDKAAAARVSRTPGVMGRILMTWLLLAAIVPGGIVFYFHLQALYREHAQHPLVGDRITIKTHHWPGIDFENAGTYALLRVNAVDDAQVDIAGCNTSSDEADYVETHCKTFRVELPPLTRGQLPELFEDGAIKRIAREDDSFGFWYGLLGMWVLLLIVHGVVSHRYLRSLH